MIRIIFLTAVVIFSACPFAPTGNAAAADIKLTKAEHVGMSTERLERIGETMRSLISEQKIPGTVTLVARRGRVVHFEASGLRDVARALPMEKDTIFRLYSQSKPVTGVAVMMLFEEGHFLLNDPISKYLPEFAEMEVYIGMLWFRLCLSLEFFYNKIERCLLCFLHQELQTHH